ncbi:MAG: type secretion system protein [Acidimicrobiales bacterium]|nr:type secretion system protein [Acidimicrobiales bacterium]
MDASSLIGATFAATGAVVIAAGTWAATADRRRGAFAVYLEQLEKDDARGAATEHTSTFDARLAQPFLHRTIRPAFARIVAVVSSVTPTDHRARVRAKLAAAGLDLKRRPEEIVALQVIGVVLGTAAATALVLSGGLRPATAVSCGLVLVVGGAALPMIWLSRAVSARVQAIRADLPDTLDLLAISVEAGVGLEGALQVVTERSSSPLAQEMSRTLQEMSLGLSRRDALTNLRHRSPVPELSNFVQALIQADSLGMPLAKVLKIQATEMRSKRRQWAREKAAKLPVKILFPLVMCIFPAVLVVVVGPAMSQIGEAFK